MFHTHPRVISGEAKQANAGLGPGDPFAQQQSLVFANRDVSPLQRPGDVPFASYLGASDGAIRVLRDARPSPATDFPMLTSEVEMPVPASRLEVLAPSGYLRRN